VKLLLISDMAATGFGRVGRELATGLLKRGWDVRIMGINWRGVDGELTAAIKPGRIAAQADSVALRLAELRADPLVDLIMPASVGGEGMGHNLTSAAFRGDLWDGWKPDAAIVVADPRAMWLRMVRDNGAFGKAKEDGNPVLNYVPIEGTGLPRDWATIWRIVRPVAMSTFGQAQIEALMGEPVALAHHGVSAPFFPIDAAHPGTWRGKPVTSRDGAKAALGLSGRTVILRTDRYVFRKNYPAFFRVMRPILQAHPEAMCVIHTVPIDDTGQGNIWQLISREPGAEAGGITRTGDMEWAHPQIRLTGWHDSWQGLTDDEMNVLYNAADLLVSPTMAEGFGLTLAEALATGLPVVATDYSAIPEVVGPGGVLIPVTGTITNAYAHEWGLVDEPAMSAAVERLISKPALRRSLGAAGRRHVARFTWSQACDTFDLLLRSQGPAVAEQEISIGRGSV
jgi:glycosyltransferase involved in cell wall biosynthesis